MKIALMAASLLVAPILFIHPVHAQDAATGERLFKQRCASCHTVQPGQNRIGPHLSGIVGRKPASVEGARYSKALAGLEANWDAAKLDAFLANPRGVAPGTTMTVSVPNATERGNLVAYLQSLTSAN